MKEGISESGSFQEARREARERILEAVERLRDDNHVVSVESETPDTITLSVSIIDPESKTVKTFHKGFMKTLNVPGGSIEEEVERQIRYPERDIEDDLNDLSGEAD